jgi:DNA-binding protein H-NS
VHVTLLARDALCVVCYALQEQTKRLEARLLKQQQQQQQQQQQHQQQQQQQHQAMQQSIADLRQQLAASEVGSELCFSGCTSVLQRSCASVLQRSCVWSG